jgi:queuosine precursor transporter
MDDLAAANNRYNYKYLLFLIAIYISCFPLIQIGLQKPIAFGYFHLNSGSLIFPITFVITDIISEVYGYKIARQLIWSHVPATIFYFLMLNFILHVPSTATWSHQSEYNYIFQGSSVVGIIGNAGLLIGYLVNIYFISKWKILIKGKYFWMRSIGSSAIGELIQLLIGASAALYAGVWGESEWLSIAISIYCMRLLMAAILSFPANLLVIILKKVEDIDIYDNNINFNPFIIST